MAGKRGSKGRSPAASAGKGRGSHGGRSRSGNGHGAPPSNGDDAPDDAADATPRRSHKGLTARTPAPALDFSKIRRYRLATRKSLVAHGALGRPLHASTTFGRFFQGLPDLLAGRELRAAVMAIAEARRARRGVILGMGAHPIKVGLSPLHGPGVTITVHDGRNPNDPTDRSLGWIVHYQDLQDLVNLLWAQGAEAVAVNDQRVVPTTSFFYAGVNILVNTASRLTGPYQVTAIGDPPALEAGP